MRLTRREVTVVAVSAAVLAAVAIGATVVLSDEGDSFAAPAAPTVEQTSPSSTTTTPSTTSRPDDPEQWFLDEISASDASVTGQLPDDAQLGIARDQCDRMTTGTSWKDAVLWMVERTGATPDESATVTTVAAIAFCPDELPES